MLLSRWFVERRHEAAALETNLPPRIEAKLHALNAKVGDLIEYRIDDHSSSITGGEYGECIVNLQKKSCSCKQYDVFKIPCEHAILAARRRDIDESILPDDCFSKETYGETYAEVIHPVDINSILPAGVKDKQVLPPFVKNPRGRPKLKRYRSVVEKAKKTARSKCVKQETKQSSPPKKRKSHQRIATQTKRQKLQPSTPTQMSRIKRVTTPPSTTNPRKHRRTDQTMPSPKLPYTRSPGIANAPAAKKKLNLGNPTPQLAKPHRRQRRCSKCCKTGHNKSTCPG